MHCKLNSRVGRLYFESDFKEYKLNYNVPQLKYLAYAQAQLNNLNAYEFCFCKPKDYFLSYKPYKNVCTKTNNIITDKLFPQLSLN